MGVKEQLGGQEMLCIQVCAFMGWEVPFSIALMESMACFHGLSKVRVNLEGAVLFQ